VSAPRSLRFDDLYVGMAFVSPSRTVTEADVVAFAGLTGDYSEVHTSEQFAERTEFGRRIAHGMLGLAYAHGLMWARTGELRDCAIAFLGIGDWTFDKPIFLGDTIHVRYEIEQLRVSRSKPDRAIATYAVQVRNQHDEIVQRGHKSLMVSTSTIGPRTAAATEGAVGERAASESQEKT
jgi:acyl dehydratase